MGRFPCLNSRRCLIASSLVSVVMKNANALSWKSPQPSNGGGFTNAGTSVIAGIIIVPSGANLAGSAALPNLHIPHVIPSSASSPLVVHSVWKSRNSCIFTPTQFSAQFAVPPFIRWRDIVMLFTIPIDPTIWKYALILLSQCAIFSGFPSYISGGSIFIVGQGGRSGSLNTSLISPIAVATPVAASLHSSGVNAVQIALIAAVKNVPTSAVNNTVQATIKVSVGVKGIFYSSQGRRK